MTFLPVLSFPVAKKLGHAIGDFVKSAELQAETMRWIAANVPTDVVLGPMDLSIEAEAFGATVRFDPDDVPAVTGQLVADASAVEALAVPRPDSVRCRIAAEAIALTKSSSVAKPVYAGMIGPFSLAGRLMNENEIMFMLLDEPEAVHALLEKATEFLIEYGGALKASGADGLFMAEPLAGIISPDALAEFSAPYVTRIVQALQTEGFPIVYHNCGGNVVKAAPAIFAQGAAGYHFGNAVDLQALLPSAPASALVMGNIDPVTTLTQGTPESIRAAVAELRQRCAAYPNFVLSSGCDIPAAAPWANLQAFFDAAVGA